MLDAADAAGLGVAVAVEDAGDLRLAFVNAHGAALLGYAPSEHLGRDVFDLLAPEEVSRVQSLWFQALRGGPVPAVVETVCLRKDGARVPVEAGVGLARLGDALAVVTFFRDARERRREEEERRASFEERKQQEQRALIEAFKVRFVNRAAHELATPLTPIVLQIQLLSCGGAGPLTGRQRKAVCILERNVALLNGILQRILDVARLDAGRLPLARRRVDLCDVVRDEVESFRPVAEAKGVALACDASGGLDVEADADRLRQVLAILLDNALKFTPAPGRVTVRARPFDGAGLVEVEDTGAGVAPDDLPRLFRPFSQAFDTEQSTRPGAGLGLAVARGIVELHGGRIWCASPGHGQGATFAFSLPLAGLDEAGHALPPA